MHITSHILCIAILVIWFRAPCMSQDDSGPMKLVGTPALGTITVEGRIGNTIVAIPVKLAYIIVPAEPAENAISMTILRVVAGAPRHSIRLVMVASEKDKSELTAVAYFNDEKFSDKQRNTTLQEYLVRSGFAMVDKTAHIPQDLREVLLKELKYSRDHHLRLWSRLSQDKKLGLWSRLWHGGKRDNWEADYQELIKSADTTQP